MNRLLIIIFSCFLISCGGKYPHTTPYVIDTQLQECREYEVIDKKNLVLKYKQSYPLDHCNGHWSIPPDQMVEWRQFLLKQKKKNGE